MKQYKPHPEPGGKHTGGSKGKSIDQIVSTTSDTEPPSKWIPHVIGLETLEQAIREVWGWPTGHEAEVAGLVAKAGKYNRNTPLKSQWRQGRVFFIPAPVDYVREDDPNLAPRERFTHPLSEYRRIPHGIQNADDGSGSLWQRTYEVRVSNPGRSARELFLDIATDFTRYTGRESYFEKLTGNDELRLGDEFFIIGGPDTQAKPNWREEWKPRGITNEELQRFPESIDENDTLHTGPVKTGVSVIDIRQDEECGQYSFSFVTWDNHVEAGTITFSVNTLADGTIQFRIASTSRSSSWLTDKAYRAGGMAGQTRHWMTFLNNVNDFLSTDQSQTIGPVTSTTEFTDD